MSVGSGRRARTWAAGALLAAMGLLAAPAADAAEAAFPVTVEVGRPEVGDVGVRVPVTAALEAARDAAGRPFAVTFRVGVLAGCAPACEPSALPEFRGSGERPVFVRGGASAEHGPSCTWAGAPPPGQEPGAGCPAFFLRGERAGASFRSFVVEPDPARVAGWESPLGPAWPLVQEGRGGATCEVRVAAAEAPVAVPCPEALPPLPPDPAPAPAADGAADGPRLTWVGAAVDLHVGPDGKRVALFVTRGELPAGPAPEDFLYVLGVQVGDRDEVLVVPAGASYKAATSAAGPTAPWERITGLLGPGALAGAAATAIVVAWWAKRKDLFAVLPPPLPFRFTRLRPHALLDQETRRRVYEAIRAEPGIRYAALRARTGLPTGVLQHHLRVLAEHDLVVDHRRGQQRHFYLTGTRAQDTPGTMPLGDRQDSILALLRHDRLDQRALAARLGITQQGVSHHLRGMLALGLVVRERGPSGTWMYASAPGAAPRAGAKVAG